MIALDQLVQANHLVRNIESALEFSFIYELIGDMYSIVGRTSIDSFILIKLAFIQSAFGIRLMGKTIDEVDRIWLIADYTITTFGKKYERRFKDNDLFEQIL